MVVRRLCLASTYRVAALRKTHRPECNRCVRQITIAACASVGSLKFESFFVSYLLLAFTPKDKRLMNQLTSPVKRKMLTDSSEQLTNRCSSLCVRCAAFGTATQARCPRCVSHRHIYCHQPAPMHGGIVNLCFT